jgi:hypothetical protein
MFEAILKRNFYIKKNWRSGNGGSNIYFKNNRANLIIAEMGSDQMN